MGNFKEDIVKTEAFIFDVDGVMTDGGIIALLLTLAVALCAALPVLAAGTIEVTEDVSVSRCV